MQPGESGEDPHQRGEAVGGRGRRYTDSDAPREAEHIGAQRFPLSRSGGCLPRC